MRARYHYHVHNRLSIGTAELGVRRVKRPIGVSHFPVARAIKPGTKFYTNLARLSALKGKTALIQYSALLTSSRRVALVTKSLAAHYGARTTVFKVVGTDL